MGFIVFFKWAFKKKTGGFFYNNPGYMRLREPKKWLILMVRVRPVSSNSPGGVFHQFAQIRHRLQHHKNAVPYARHGVHRRKVETELLAHDHYHCGHIRKKQLAEACM